MPTDSLLPRPGFARSDRRKLPRSWSIHHQRGALAIIFAGTLIFIIALLGLALDLSRLFNRKVDLQVVADVTAMAAAQSLVGTAAGIDAARDAAAAAAAKQKYNYGSSVIPWSDAAMQFSSSPHTGWIGAEAAKADPSQIMFVRVNTTALNMGSLKTYFLRIVSKDLIEVSTAAESVAGRATVKVTPLAICAMSAVAASSRPPRGELVEYGFRRGVAYDLMQLSSTGASPANFLLNPIDSSTSGESISAPVVGPFVCAGKMPSLGMVGEKVTAVEPFPLASLYQHLNSRFGQYPGGACDFRSAPPDANVKSFVYTANSLWMHKTPLDQTPASILDAGKLMTIADPDPHPAANTAASYGQLWTYAKPVPFSAYIAGQPEPVTGYSAFPQGIWHELYSPGEPKPKSYPSATPYKAFGQHHTSPPPSYGMALRNRRVLNVPLLACPVGAGSKATVVAIGKFFMTVPATSTKLRAEFAGIASEHTLKGTVEFYK